MMSMMVGPLAHRRRGRLRTVYLLLLHADLRAVQLRAIELQAVDRAGSLHAVEPPLPLLSNVECLMSSMMIGPLTHRRRGRLAH